MDPSKNVLHLTESVCPVCLEKIPAKHVFIDGDIYLQKSCERHGDFAAYQNLLGKKDRTKISDSITRGSFIKGGGCGYYGTCGACVGAGIAVSVIENVTPMSVDKRALANTVTGLALLEISKSGGPRFCKRETISSIKTFIKNPTYFENMPEVDYICKQYEKNKDCVHNKCIYYPNK